MLVDVVDVLYDGCSTQFTFLSFLSRCPTGLYWSIQYFQGRKPLNWRVVIASLCSRFFLCVGVALLYDVESADESFRWKFWKKTRRAKVSVARVCITCIYLNTITLQHGNVVRYNMVLERRWEKKCWLMFPHPVCSLNNNSVGGYSWQRR